MPKPNEPLFSDFPAVSAEEWVAQIEKELKGRSYQTLKWSGANPFELEPFYTRKILDEIRDLDSAPGQPPFLRGNHFHSSDPGWQAVQSFDLATPGLENLVEEAIAAGMVAFALRADDKEHLETLKAILTRIDLGQRAVHLNLPQPANLSVADVLMAVAEGDIAREKVTGTLINDPLGRNAAQFKTPSETEWINCEGGIQASGKMENFRSLGLDFSYLHELGASHTQELAFALATISEYLVHLPDYGSEVTKEDILKNLALRLASGTSFFPELAKYRALRMLLNRLFDGFDIPDGPLRSPFVTAQTGRRSLTLYDRHNNLLRQTTAAISAIAGGVQALEIPPFDVLSEKGRPESQRYARNIQFLLKNESYLDQVLDPAGGSYYVEKLTIELARAAWSLFQEVERAGGYLAVIKSGWLPRQLEAMRKERQKEVANRRRTIVGVNQYANAGETLTGDFVSPPNRDATDFEALRLQADQYGVKRGRRLQAFLFNFGDVRMRNARLQFARNLLSAGGFELAENKQGISVEEAVTQAQEANPDVVILCAGDPDYQSQGEALLARLAKALPAVPVIQAGKPLEEGQPSVADHIFAGMDALKWLEQQVHRITN